MSQRSPVKAPANSHQGSFTSARSSLLQGGGEDFVFNKGTQSAVISDSEESLDGLPYSRYEEGTEFQATDYYQHEDIDGSNEKPSPSQHKVDVLSRLSCTESNPFMVASPVNDGGPSHVLKETMVVAPWGPTAQCAGSRDSSPSVTDNSSCNPFLSQPETTRSSSPMGPTTLRKVTYCEPSTSMGAPATHGGEEPAGFRRNSTVIKLNRTKSKKVFRIVQ